MFLYGRRFNTDWPDLMFWELFNLSRSVSGEARSLWEKRKLGNRQGGNKQLSETSFPLVANTVLNLTALARAALLCRKKPNDLWDATSRGSTVC